MWTFRTRRRRSFSLWLVLPHRRPRPVERLEVSPRRSARYRANRPRRSFLLHRRLPCRPRLHLLSRVQQRLPSRRRRDDRRRHRRHRQCRARRRPVLHHRRANPSRLCLAPSARNQRRRLRRDRRQLQRLLRHRLRRLFRRPATSREYFKAYRHRFRINRWCPKRSFLTGPSSPSQLSRSTRCRSRRHGLPRRFLRHRLLLLPRLSRYRRRRWERRHWARRRWERRL